ncbi:uncharacterized protein LOC111831529 [Capsella rubella]|uniref:uncharacterized protein LOC111831529 n=1 Tax=Capsella rubella TaxID=81985 RepID=UPI000CD49DE6|nr:uncharacterized protein LOC111831529 [Capsella rubella]
MDVVNLANSEARAWQQAQVDDTGQPMASQLSFPRVRGGPPSLRPSLIGYHCFVDGSWKATDAFSGICWFCQHSSGHSTIRGAMNVRRSLSPLHSEVEALVWAVRCMVGHNFRDVVFLTDCSDLVKMVSSPSDWPAFSVYLDDIHIDMEEFSSFSLSLIPRNANVKADFLARKVRTIPLHVKYVNNVPSDWLV